MVDLGKLIVLRFTLGTDSLLVARFYLIRCQSRYLVWVLDLDEVQRVLGFLADILVLSLLEFSGRLAIIVQDTPQLPG